MHTLADYIMEIDDALPPDLIADLLNEYANADIWSPYTTAVMGGGEVIPVSDAEIIGESAIRQALDDRLTESFTAVVKRYVDRNHQLNNGNNFLMMERFTGFRLLRYSVGQYMWLHADRYPNSSGKHEWPVLTCTININADYEGGELVLLNGEITVVTKPGNAAMFPANFMYPHEVKEVTRGTRYAIVTWVL